MSFSLPYDHPALVLGHIVPPALLSLLDKIRSIQGRTDAAQERMHSLMSMRRSLTMTLSEMMSMGIDVTALEERIEELNQSIAQAASDYIGKRLANDMAIQAERDRILDIDLSNVSESPLDFSKIEVKRHPLGSDNLQIDIQYFKHQGTEAPEGAVRARVEQMVRENTAGPPQQVSDLSKKAGALVAQQQESHDLVGTLVITANAMHRSVAMLEPVRLDVTKSIDAWNASFGSPALRLNPDDPMSMVKLASQTRGDAVDKSLTLLTGAVYGSSFVGMIHLVRSKMSPSGLSNVDIAAIMERVRLSAAVKAESGGIGAESSVLEDVRQMINDQGFTAHVSIIVHGALTAPGAKHVENLVDKAMQVPSRMPFAGPFPMAGAALANAARSAQTAAQAEAGKVSGLATTLSTVDKSSAAGIDLGTLFTAFDNYLAAVTKADAVGAPIGFYVKRINAAQIAREWLDQAEKKWNSDQSADKNQTPSKTNK